MTAQEYKAARRRIGTWKYAAAQLGIDWRTVAKREAGTAKISPEAAHAIRAVPPSWLAEVPELPAITGRTLALIPGFPGYAASKCGRVYSCRSKYPNKEFPYRAWFEMTPTKGVRDYWVIGLVSPGGRRQIKLHQAILLAFVGPPPPGCVGCHEDDNPDHNYLSNLRWDTYKANSEDKTRNGGHPDRRGMKHPMAKLTELDIAAIKARRASGEILRTIGADFGVSEGMVSLISNNKTWKHLNN